MAPVNVHEIQAIAAKNVSHAVYEYASGGSEDDATLLGNLEAYRRTVLRRRVFVDVSNIDTTLDVLGQKLPFPIMIAPASKNRVVPQGDKVAAIGAHGAKALYGIVGNAHSFIGELTKAGQAPLWMSSTLGHDTRAEASDWAKRNEEAGATWNSVTVDHQFTPNRDNNIRNGFPGYESGVLRPSTPTVTWEYLEWIRSGSKLPIVVKGILNGEDAEAAVKYGANAIIVSNHRRPRLRWRGADADGAAGMRGRGRRQDPGVHRRRRAPRHRHPQGAGARRQGRVHRAAALLGPDGLRRGRRPARRRTAARASSRWRWGWSARATWRAINRSMVRLPWEV